MIPDTVNVPAPVLTSDVALVPIAPLIDVVPTDSTVNAKPPETVPVMVNDVPVSTCTSAAPDNVTLPLQVFEPETLLIAPAAETPVPMMETGSVTPDKSPDNLMVAPLAIDVEDRLDPSSPRAVLFETAMIPLVSVVNPV